MYTTFRQTVLGVVSDISPHGSSAAGLSVGLQGNVLLSFSLDSHNNGIYRLKLN